MYHIFKLKLIKSIWNFSFMVSHTVYFKGMMAFTLTMQMYHRISVLVPVLVWVPEYLSTSTSTMTLELMSMSTERVPEMQYSSTESSSTEYEYPSPAVTSYYKEKMVMWLFDLSIGSSSCGKTVSWHWNGPWVHIYHAHHEQVLDPQLNSTWQSLVLTHLPLVPHVCVSESGQHWFR